MDWLSVKLGIADTIGISRDALHIVSGFGIQALLVLALRSWFGAILPWLLTLLTELGNEWIDLTFEVWAPAFRSRQWTDSIKDVVLTLLVPTFLLMLSRWAPAKLRRPEAPIATQPREHPASDQP